MARKPRLHFAGAFYHIIARGNKGAKVFKSTHDKALFWSGDHWIFGEGFRRAYYEIGLRAFWVGPDCYHPGGGEI